MPTDLHIDLQRYYAGEDGLIETRLDGYVIDVLRDGVIYEIQTRNLWLLRDKLRKLAKTHPVVLVYPVPATRFIVRVDPETGEELSKRRSPKRGDIHTALEELPRIAQLLGEGKVALEVAFTVERELRADDGKGSWRRKGVSLCGRELVEVTETVRFEKPEDYLRLLPEGLPEQFTTGDIAGKGVRKWVATRIAYCLKHIGAIKQVGKRSNWYLYEGAEASGRKRRKSTMKTRKHETTTA